ncbi:MAG TPA: hypothetical protein VNM92_05300 [Thermoanaerobaculia bacterium]|nr:hypothetical protein [Thermoanaerobaculia bacterium]
MRKVKAAHVDDSDQHSLAKLVRLRITPHSYRRIGWGYLANSDLW